MRRYYNGLKTALLLGGMSALVILVGSFFGRTGLVVALLQRSVSMAMPISTLTSWRCG